MKIRSCSVVALLFVLLVPLGPSANCAANEKARALAHLNRARSFAAEYKADKAANEAQRALEDDPSLAEAYVYLGLPSLRKNKLKEAEGYFRKAIAMDPYQALAHCYLGYVLFGQGDIEAATDEWTDATKLDPTLPQAFAGLAIAQFKQGERRLAAKTYEKVLSYDRRYDDEKFLASDKGPHWSGTLLETARQLLPLVHKTSLY
jgi:Tfp pilus assembly protein PilF